MLKKSKRFAWHFILLNFLTWSAVPRKNGPYGRTRVQLQLLLLNAVMTGQKNK